VQPSPEITSFTKLVADVKQELNRRDLDPVLESRLYERVRDAGRRTFGDGSWSLRKTATVLGRPHSLVCKRLRLLDLPPEIQDQVTRGALGPEQAYSLLKTSRRRHQEPISTLPPLDTDGEAADPEADDERRRRFYAEGILLGLLHVMPDGTLRLAMCAT
jgi:ParB-like chromosome segregation protein Spo0J